MTKAGVEHRPMLFYTDVLYFMEYNEYFFTENDAEILHAHYTWKVSFTNLSHKQCIQVKL
jgi:hypothetical protein